VGELDHYQYGHNLGTHDASPNHSLGSGLSNLTDMQGMNMSGMDMARMAISASEQLALLISASADTSSTPGTLPDSPGANIASAVTTPPLGSESISTLSFMLLLFLLRRNSELRPLEIGLATAERSQTAAIPELPPPRLNHVCA
jgi:hypothetical protein